MTTQYAAATAQLSTVVPEVHRIDRVQLGKNGEIEFCIDVGAWMSWVDGRLMKRVALGDASLPLACWASGKPKAEFNVLAYRPNRRLVLLDLKHMLVLKGYTGGKSRRAADRHSVAHRVASESGVTTPDVLWHDARRETVALRFCRGAPLQICPGKTEELSALGAIMGRLQGTDYQARALPVEKPLRRFSAIQEMAVLDDWAQRVGDACETLPDGWQRLRQDMESVVPTSHYYVLNHRDLHGGQWLRRDNELALLDFDSLCLADPALDIGNFIAHIALTCLQQGQHGAERERLLIAAFIEGYRKTAAHRCKQLEFYRMTSLMRLALVYAVRPRWRHLARPLTDHARRSLDRWLQSS